MSFKGSGSDVTSSFITAAAADPNGISVAASLLFLAQGMIVAYLLPLLVQMRQVVQYQSLLQAQILIPLQAHNFLLRLPLSRP